MKNNQGVTLIELIIVIIIIGILSGGAIVGIKSIQSGNAQAAVERISALLDYVRAENMSRDHSYYFILEEEENHYYARIQSEENGIRTTLLTEKLKFTEGSIFYTNELDIAYTIDSSVSPSVRLELKFDKETGGVSIGGDGHLIESITISSGGRIYTIHLVTITGKHYIE